jgi:hypothetical protein
MGSHDVVAVGSHKALPTWEPSVPAVAIVVSALAVVTGERVAAAHMSPAAIPELIFRAMVDIVPPVCAER